MLALHLLQICLVYIHTLMIQRVITEPDWTQRMLPEDLRALTPLIYSHSLRDFSARYESEAGDRTRYGCCMTATCSATLPLVTRMFLLGQRRESIRSLGTLSLKRCLPGASFITFAARTLSQKKEPSRHTRTLETTSPDTLPIANPIQLISYLNTGTHSKPTLLWFPWSRWEVGLSESHF